MLRVTDIQDTRDGIIVSLDDQTQFRIQKPLTKVKNMEFDSPSHHITFTQTRRSNVEDVDMAVLDKRTQIQDDIMIRPMHQGQIEDASAQTTEEEEEERVIEGPQSFASGEDWMAIARRAKHYRPRPPQTATDIPYTDEPDPYSGGRKRRRTNRSLSKSLRRRQSRRSRKSRGSARTL